MACLGLAPRAAVSGGKALGRKKRGKALGAIRVAGVLCMSAASLKHSPTALGAALRHKGMAVAIFRIACKLARLVYRMLRCGQELRGLWRQRIRGALPPASSHQSPSEGPVAGIHRGSSGTVRAAHASRPTGLGNKAAPTPNCWRRAVCFASGEVRLARRSSPPTYFPHDRMTRYPLAERFHRISFSVSSQAHFQGEMFQRGPIDGIRRMRRRGGGKQQAQWPRDGLPVGWRGLPEAVDAEQGGMNSNSGIWQVFHAEVAATALLVLAKCPSGNDSLASSPPTSPTARFSRDGFDRRHREFQSEESAIIREPGAVSVIDEPLSTVSVDVDTQRNANVRCLPRARELPCAAAPPRS